MTETITVVVGRVHASAEGVAEMQAAMLAEIANPAATRATVADQYENGLLLVDPSVIDWPQVNRAILARWSTAGLLHIKKLAWKRIQK